MRATTTATRSCRNARRLLYAWVVATREKRELNEAGTCLHVPATFVYACGPEFRLRVLS